MGTFCSDFLLSPNGTFRKKWKSAKRFWKWDFLTSKKSKVSELFCHAKSRKSKSRKSKSIATFAMVTQWFHMLSLWVICIFVLQIGVCYVNKRELFLWSIFEKPKFSGPIRMVVAKFQVMWWWLIMSKRGFRVWCSSYVNPGQFTHTFISICLCSRNCLQMWRTISQLRHSRGRFQQWLL